MSFKIKIVLLTLLLTGGGGSIYYYLDKQVVEIGWVYGEVLAVDTYSSSLGSKLTLDVAGVKYHFIGKNSKEFINLQSLTGESISVHYQKKILINFRDQHSA